MATKKEAAPKEQTKAVANWRAEMQADAAKAAEMEKATGGGKFFSMRAGVLSYDDTPLPGNQMACVITDAIMENVYYAESFDSDNRVPPTCFAFGREEDEMEPHEKVDEEDCFTRQSEMCEGCPQNEWGSADKGRGKACGNRRRLAIIPAGVYSKKGELELFDEADAFKSSELAFMKLPVTSVKNYSRYVRECADQIDRPPYAVFTRIYVEPDAKSQFKVNFELLEEIDDDLMEVIFKRHKEAADVIAFPYNPPSEEDTEDAEQKSAKRASSTKKLTGGAAKKGRQSKAKK